MCLCVCVCVCVCVCKEKVHQLRFLVRLRKESSIVKNRLFVMTALALALMVITLT